MVSGPEHRQPGRRWHRISTVHRPLRHPVTPTLLPGLAARRLRTVLDERDHERSAERSVVVRGAGGGIRIRAADVHGEDALEIASNAKRFLDAGVDARHLRGWRVAGT